MVCFIKNKNNLGFSLIELIIVVVLIVIIMAMALPASISFLQKQRIEEETIRLADNIKIVQARAIAGKNDSAWGIKLNEPEQGKYTLFPLFQAASFSDPERDTTYDEVFELSPGAATSGAEEIIFEKITGKPRFE